eukprot:15472773-Alexandrium_andersonii.AAC.1
MGPSDNGNVQDTLEADRAFSMGLMGIDAVRLDAAVARGQDSGDEPTTETADSDYLSADGDEVQYQPEVPTRFAAVDHGEGNVAVPISVELSMDIGTDAEVVGPRLHGGGAGDPAA